MKGENENESKSLFGLFRSSDVSVCLVINQYFSF
ncbi:hypothetical protein EA74_02369 [Enterococcus hirae]|nr:hypothetical protein EA74_02369 [Enterococcus hirae]